MRKAILILMFGCLVGLSQAQSLTSTKETRCNVRVAYAVSEGDVFGEYSITELLMLTPGETVRFKGREFVNRRIYRASFDEMFIVRFESTGVTHFLDARAAQGYERILVGGCSLDQRASFHHDGSFYIDASAN